MLRIFLGSETIEKAQKYVNLKYIRTSRSSIGLLIAEEEFVSILSFQEITH